MNEAGKERIRIAIVGAGAMGCLLAVMFHKAGLEVVLIEKQQDRTKWINERGLLVEGVPGESRMKIRAVDDPTEAGQCDLLIFAVKAYDTANACQGVGLLLTENSSVLTLQNGVGNVEILCAEFGPEKVLGGTTSFGATALGPGHIRYAGAGETVVAERVNRGGRLYDVIGLINTAGLNASAADDLDGLIWGKVLINVGINAITAVAGVRNGVLVRDENGRALMRMAVEEAERIVKALGVTLPYEYPVAKAEAVARGTAENVSSMLQDVAAHRRTEIEFINGAIVHEGRRLGIPTPVNEVLSLLVEIKSDVILP